MALKKLDVLRGAFSLNGEPWVNIVTKSKFETKALHFSFMGDPWHGVKGGNIKKIAGVSLDNIKKCSGIYYQQINKVQEIDY